MTERTPKSECTRKIEQDRSISKILTFGQHLHKSQFFWKLYVCTISELRMKKRIPKSECTRKIEWDRSILKILTSGQHLHRSPLFLEIGRLHNFWTSNEETGPKIGMYSKNRVGQVRFENFDFLVKVKSLLGPFFFFFFFSGGSDPGQTGSVRSGWWRHGWRHCSGRVWHVWRMTSSMTSYDSCGTCDFWRILIGAWDLKAAPPNLFAARGGACLGFWA